MVQAAFQTGLISDLTELYYDDDVHVMTGGFFVSPSGWDWGFKNGGYFGDEMILFSSTIPILGGILTFYVDVFMVL